MRSASIRYKFKSVKVNWSPDKPALYIEYGPFDTIFDLKERIEHKTGIKVEKQILFNLKQVLKNSKNVFEYKIPNGHFLRLQLKAEDKLETIMKKTKRDIPDLLYANHETIEEVQQEYDMLKGQRLGRDQNQCYWDIGYHGSTMLSMAQTSDGKYVVSAGGKDAFIKVFDLEKGDLIDRIAAYDESKILTIAMSPSNKYVATGSDRGAVRVYNFKTKLLHHEFKISKKNVIKSIVFSNDSRYLISGSSDNSIRVFNVEKKREEKSFPDAHRRPITAVAISYDRQYIISASEDQTVKVFDFDSKKLFLSYDVNTQKLEGEQIVVQFLKEVPSVISSMVQVASPPRAQPKFQFSLGVNSQGRNSPGSHTPCKNGLLPQNSSDSHSPSKNVLLPIKEQLSLKAGGVSDDPAVLLIPKPEGKTPTNQRTSPKAQDVLLEVEEVEFVEVERMNREAPQREQSVGVQLAKGKNPSKLANPADNKKEKEIYPTSLHITKNSNKVIIGLSEGSVRVLSLSDDRDVKIDEFTNIHKEAISSVYCSKDGLHLVTGSEDKLVKIHTMDAKNELKSSFSHEHPVNSVLVSNDDKYVVSGSKDKSIKVFDLVNEKIAYHFKNPHSGSIPSIIISKDNKYIISGSEDKCIKFFDIEQKKEICRIKDAFPKAITSVILSNDNKYIVVAGLKDKNIRVFDFTTKELAAVFNDVHKDEITALAITNDNKYIISGSLDKTVKVLDLEKNMQSELGKLQRRLAILHRKKAQLVKATERKKKQEQAIVGDISSFIELDDYEQYKDLKDIGQEIKKLEESVSNESKTAKDFTESPFDRQHQKAITTIALSKDDRYLVTSSGDLKGSKQLTDEYVIKVFNFESRSLITTLEDVHIGMPPAISISNDSKYIIISGSNDKLVSVVAYETKKKICTFDHTDAQIVNSALLTNDNKYLVSGSQGGTLRVFDFSSKRLIHHFEKIHAEAISAVVVSSDNQFIVSSSKDHTIKVSKLEVKKEIKEINLSLHAEEKTNFLGVDSLCNKCMILSTNDKLIQRFDFATRSFQEMANKKGSEIKDILVSNDGQYVFLALGDRSTDMLNYQGELVHKFENVHKSQITAMAISNDNRHLLVGSRDGATKLYNTSIRDEGRQQERDGHTETVTAFAFSDNSEIFASGSDDRAIKVCSLETGELIHSFESAHTDSISSIAISANVKFLTSGSDDKSVKIFDLLTGQEVCCFENLDTNVISVRFISNDRFIVVASEKSVCLYDCSTEKCMHTFALSLPPEVKINSMALSKERKEVMISLSNKTIKVLAYPAVGNNGFVSSKTSLYSGFNPYDDFLLSPFHISHRLEALFYYQDLYLLPHNWTILHIAAIFRHSDITHLCSSQSFRVPFLVDSYGKTPLHYLLAHQEVDYQLVNTVLQYMLEYLEEENTSIFEWQTVTLSMNSIFFILVRKVNPTLLNRCLKLFYKKSPVVYGHTLPQFGVPKKKFFISKLPCLKADIKEEMLERGQDPVVFKTSMLYLDYHSASDDMLCSVLTFRDMKDEDFFKSPAISGIVEYLWNKAQPALISAAILFSILMLLMSVYIALGERVLGMEITIISIACLFLVNEFFQIKTIRSNYLKSPWNFADIILFVLMISYIVTRFVNNDDPLGEGWVVSVIVIVGYMRWLSYLRLFDNTRNLIQVIMSVIADMLGFMIIIGFIIFGFSLIFMEFQRETDSQYVHYLFASYKLLYAAFDDSSFDQQDGATSGTNKFFLALILFIFNVLLLNLLISIMGDTFEKVQNRRVLNDSLTKLDMVLDSMSVLRLFGGRRKKRGYLITCVVDNNGEEGDFEPNEWDGKINIIKKILKQNEQKIIESSGATERKVNEINMKVEQVKDEMNKQADITHGKLEESQNKIERDLNSVKQEVEVLKKLMIDGNEKLLETIKSLLKLEQSNQLSV